MIAKMQSNPIANRVLQKNYWPSPGMTIVLGIITGKVGIGLAVFGLITRSPGFFAIEPIPAIILIVNVAAGVASVLISGLTAASFVSRDKQDGKVNLLQITPITEREIVSGYITATAIRLRLQWAVLIGLVLAMLVSLLHLMAELRLVLACQLVDSPYCVFTQSIWEFIPPSIRQALLVTLLFAVLVGLLNRLSIYVGVWIAFMKQQWLPIPAAAGLILGGLMLPPLGVLWWMFGAQIPRRGIHFTLAALGIGLAYILITWWVRRQVIRNM